MIPNNSRTFYELIDSNQMVIDKHQYIKQLSELYQQYPGEVLAKALGVTLRQVQKYLQAKNPPTPKAKTVAKIRASFARHEKGLPIIEAKNDDENGLKDEMIAFLKKDKARLENELEVSLNELREELLLIRTLGSINRSILEELLAKARKTSLEQIGLETNRLFAEHYKRGKAAGKIVYDNK